jgi:signal transduction histidine kinase
MTAYSLRGRAALVAGVVCAVTLTLCAIGVWFWLRAIWISGFEQAMRERAHTIGMQIYSDEERETLGFLDAGRPSEAFAVWDETGKLLRANAQFSVHGLVPRAANEQKSSPNFQRTIWLTVARSVDEDDQAEERDAHEEFIEKIRTQALKDTRQQADQPAEQKRSVDEAINQARAQAQRQEQQIASQVQPFTQHISAQKLSDNKESPQQHVIVAVAWDATALAVGLAQVFWVLIICVIVTTGISAAALWFAMRAAVKPVTHLAQAIAQMEPGSHAPTLNGPHLPSEMITVAARVDHFVQRVQLAMERERSFSSAIAHELRTPLAGLRAQLEQRQFQPAEQTTCHDIVLHMQAIIEKLLLLTRLHSGQIHVARQACDMIGLIEAIFENYHAVAETKKLQLTWNMQAGVVVLSDRDLLRRLLDNILHNAVSHTKPGGDITIIVEQHALGQRFTCENSGCTLPVGDAMYTTARFWRGDSARPVDAAHHCGLGLALCAEIASALALPFHVSVNERHSFVVQLEFPIASLPTSG